MLLPPPGPPRTRLAAPLLASIVVVGSPACAFLPQPIPIDSVRTHAQSASDRGVTVSASVLTPDEARLAFGVDLDLAGVQVIWLEIDNRDDGAYLLMTRSLDARYFTPVEVARRASFTFAPWNDEAIQDTLRSRSLPMVVPSNSAVAGCAYVAVERGPRIVPVELVGSGRVRRFNFFLSSGAPDDADARALLRDRSLAPNRTSLDLDRLRAGVAALPRCVTDESGRNEGDPLNLVIVGRLEDVLGAFARAGWDEPEVVDLRSGVAFALSAAFGTTYRYAPMSDLFLFGRSQDISLQKMRDTVYERSHLRLWLSPWNHDGRPIWVGQASRDVGLRLTTTTWNLFTHVIDPDVDRERQYVVEDLIASETVQFVGFAAAAGAAKDAGPAEYRNLNGDPYRTDSLRAVLALDATSPPDGTIQLLDWDDPTTASALPAGLADGMDLPRVPARP